MAVTTTYEVHPLAHLLPEMRDAEYAELRDDIAANGLHEAITLYEKKILDGRHRYRACEELGVGAHYVIYDGDAPAAYVLSLNVKRRQLTPSQRAMLATDFLPHLAKEAKARPHMSSAPRDAQGHVMANAESEDAALGRNPGRSAQRAAEQTGASHAQVIRANKVKSEDAELAERVRNGEVTVTAAYTTVTEREKLADRTAVLRGEPRKNAHASLDTPRGQEQAKAHARRFTDLASALAGYAGGIQNLDIALIRAAMEPTELDEWISSLGKSLSKLRRFRTDLQEGRN